MHKVFLALILSCTITLSGCLPLILGGVAAVGYMSNQERGTKEALSDINIKTRIKDRLTSQNYKYLTQVEVSVLKGSVLLTGVVNSAQAASEVEAVVRSVEAVQDIYNELYTDGIYPATQYSKDTWIATELKSYMFTNKDIHAVNYQVLAVNGHAYIFGLAKDGSEREVVRHLARTTKGVVQVHTFIQLYVPEIPISKSFFKLPKMFSTPTIDSEQNLDD